MDFRLEQGFIWCEMWSLTLWMTFCVLVPMIWGIWAPFHNLPQIPKSTKKGITQPAAGLYTWVKLHLMRNVDFKTLTVYWYTWFGLNLGLICSTCPNSTDIYTKSGINWLLDGLYIWVRLHLMWNIEYNILNDKPMIWDFWSSVSLICPNASKLDLI